MANQWDLLGQGAVERAAEEQVVEEGAAVEQVVGEGLLWYRLICGWLIWRLLQRCIRRTSRGIIVIVVIVICIVTRIFRGWCVRTFHFTRKL